VAKESKKTLTFHFSGLLRIKRKLNLSLYIDISDPTTTATPLATSLATAQIAIPTGTATTTKLGNFKLIHPEEGVGCI